MLSKEEKKYIKRAIIERLKYMRYMIYVMLIICLILIGFPMSFRYLLAGDIFHAITSILGIIYPTLFFGGFYLLFEWITGNQIIKFIKGNYTFSREIVHSKYRIDSMVSSNSKEHWLRRTFNYFCDTQNHTKVLFVDEDSYRNAQVGEIAIIIQFGKNLTEAFVLPKK